MNRQTLQIFLALANLYLAYAAPTIANHTLELRGNTNWIESAHLWSRDGPSCADIHQHELPDCFLAATLCILADRNKEWLMSAVRIEQVIKEIGPDANDDPDYRAVSEASFNIFNRPEDFVIQAITESASGTTYIYAQAHGTNKWIKMNFVRDIRGESSDQAEGVFRWWVSGFQQAFADVYTDEYINGDGGWSAHALNALTNREVVMVHAANKEDWWKIFSKAKNNVVMLGTLPEAKRLVRSHAYAVFDAWEDSGVRKVKLRNPWGPMDDFNFDDIASDLSTMTHFKHWDILEPPSNPTPHDIATTTAEVSYSVQTVGPGGDII